MADEPVTPTEATPSRADRAAETERTLRAAARLAVGANRDFLDLTSPTAAQNAAQVRALTRQVSALIRLVLAGDLLEQDDD